MLVLLVRFAAVALIFSCLHGGWLHAENAPSDNTLAGIFTSPPAGARPWTYWYWMHGKVTKEGITRDLEAMKELGLGGAYLFSIGGPTSLTPEWWEWVRFAHEEAARLGLRLAMNASDGWGTAGGPWITPELSMQEVVWTKRVVAAGEPAGKLDEPASVGGFYKDIAVLAYPAVGGPEKTSTELRPRITSSVPGLDLAGVVDGSLEKAIVLGRPGWIQFEFAEPFTCRSIRVNAGNNYRLNEFEVQVSADGKTFQTVGRTDPDGWTGWQDKGMGATHAVPEATGRFFRLVFDFASKPRFSENREGTRAPHGAWIRHIELSSGARIPQWEGKAGYRWRRNAWADNKLLTPEECVPKRKILNLTDKLQADGTLDWTPEEGTWVVQRFGHTSTGRKNAFAGRNGAGLESDKLNPAATRVQFDGWLGEVVKQLGPDVAGKTLGMAHTDSWEAYSQNWSPVFREEFQRLRGYDPVPWLPVISGVPIGSAGESERFLHDVRRTISDLLATSYFGEFRRACNEHGIAMSAQNVAPTMMTDGLEYFREVDVPMGEFWFAGDWNKPNDISDAVNAGRIYGKPVVQAEAFTQSFIRWNEHPFVLKPMGDFNLTRGVNRLVFHVWAHQHGTDKPGTTLNSIGTFFSSTQTWNRPGRAWVDTVSRSQALLQSGKPVVDVLFFTGEEIPSRSFLPEDLPMPVPEGYAFGSINRDALLHRATGRDGRIVMPDGMEYRVLVVPDAVRMSPEVAAKIGELAGAGVPVLANAQPREVFSLNDYKANEKKLAEIVSRTWKTVKIGGTPADLLADIAPAVTFPGVMNAPVIRPQHQYTSRPLEWTHRQIDGADVFYVSHQEFEPRDVEVSFRGTGRVPEIWNPATGRMRDAGLWRFEDGRTVVRTRFEPAESLFFVFRRNAAQDLDPAASVRPVFVQAPDASPLPPISLESDGAWASRDGRWIVTKASGRSQRYRALDVPAPRQITGPWQLQFPSGLGAPESTELGQLASLHTHRESGIRHFSGTVTYKADFELAADWDPKTGRHWIDLGQVANIAELSVNGEPIATLWKPPFLAEVTGKLRPGRNTLEVRVTNTWKNRILADYDLPEDQRITRTENYGVAYRERPEPLEPSGLIGPVFLRTTVLAQETER